jgi:hypothetical protein
MSALPAFRRKFALAVRTAPVALATFVVSVMAAAPLSAQGTAMHKCDPVTDEGWSVVPERQVLGTADGTPYQSGPAGSWYLDRVTTVLPFCHYFNAVGNYSLRSYSLAPVKSEERVAICRPGGGGSVPVPPYPGPCPPR